MSHMAIDDPRVRMLMRFLLCALTVVCVTVCSPSPHKHRGHAVTSKHCERNLALHGSVRSRGQAIEAASTLPGCCLLAVHGGRYAEGSKRMSVGMMSSLTLGPVFVARSR
jgi:hypothetical protein